MKIWKTPERPNTSIHSIEVRNFRRFERFFIDFHPEMTVLVAPNGQGKSSILDAISIAVSPFVAAFDLGKGRGITKSDARYQRQEQSLSSEQMFPVEIEANFAELPSNTKRALIGPKGKTTNKDASELSAYGSHLMLLVRSLEPVVLPVIAHYGTGRLWQEHKNMARKSVLSESRTMGYEDCLTTASNYKQLQQWFTKATYAELQQQQMADVYQGYSLKSLMLGIQSTVERVLMPSTGWQQFHYSLSHEELAMSHPEQGILPMSLLSDGVRAMVSLVSDLAWRCAKLNPHLGINAPLETPGLVLIDEVDMHLHPDWQQTVLTSLQAAFPKVQFIVTTHSPQVISTVRTESIRILGQNVEGHEIAAMPLASTYGEPSNRVLQTVMQVDPQPPIAEKNDLKRLTELVDQGQGEADEANTLMQTLLGILGDTHPQLQRLRRSIERQKRLAGWSDK